MAKPAEKLAILGVQWGDEGKGKLVDLLSARFSNVVRFQGGNNAGHTVVAGGKTIALHQIPSGVLHPSCFLVVGSGVVINLEGFREEVEKLRALGIEVLGRLLLSSGAHIILPYHIALDKWRESFAGRIGTTGRGIGPAYETKAARIGIRLGDLHNQSGLLKKIENLHKEIGLITGGQVALPDPESVLADLNSLSQPLLPCIGDTHEHLFNSWKKGESILFEGAQAAMLDIDHGTYPFVTSSSCGIGGLFTGTGLPPKALHKVVGVAKAYTTRVGEGPFPSELDGPIGETLRQAGHEFGTTTGRPRRCGWFDAVLARYACQLNGADGLCLMKLDVLDGFDRIGIVKGYRHKDSKDVISSIFSIHEWDKIEPITEYFDGWRQPVKGIDKWGGLPPQAKKYVRTIEEYIETPIAYVSTGPERETGLLAPGSCLKGLL